MSDQQIIKATLAIGVAGIQWRQMAEEMERQRNAAFAERAQQADALAQERQRSAALIDALIEIDSLTSGGTCVIGTKGKQRYFALIGEKARALLAAARDAAPSKDGAR